MHPIVDILDDLRRGKMVVLIDDEARENEGDLVCAAEFVTPEVVNFMVREGRGVLCLAMTGAMCDRLELHPQSSVNTTQRSTAFTVTIDAHEKFGITTGVSARDRATTVRVAIDPNTKPTDLARPGHINPLRARDGGVLVRAGQTEGSVDLCRLAGLTPAAAIIEVMNDDGSMARLPDLEKLCTRHGIKMCSVADVIHHRLERDKLVERIDTVPFDSAFGKFKLIAYRSRVDAQPHVALVRGSVGNLAPDGQPVEIDRPVLVRMHSQNLLGDVFGDATQPTGQTLHRAMKMIDEAGEGAIVYLRHEMAGRGLLQRLQSLHHEVHDDDGGLKLGRSQPTPGSHPPTHHGAYGIGCQILRDLGVRRIKLITDHPFQPTALQGFGLLIEAFVPAT
ncbi:MAG: 3,4-dihydroxy-2-butanone-4-phosphate synthase [Phycisphaera sp.]|nr:3,4-dihydroxy-2-butanone-4-phosphate synthase [Phycisphaera sp.]